MNNIPPLNQNLVKEIIEFIGNQNEELKEIIATRDGEIESLKEQISEYSERIKIRENEISLLELRNTVLEDTGVDIDAQETITIQELDR